VAEAPDDAVDRLYGLAREAFVGERDALAKQLRADGRRDEAAAVKALPKPTVAAWAANQAVRSQKRGARELWKAGDALSAAQDAVLAGKGSGAKLREASERERAAVETLVDAARGLLGASGGDLSETTIERVRETLHAGAIDSEAREEVAAGRAVRERSPQGLFGADPFAVPAPKRAAKTEPAPKPKPEPKAKAKAKASSQDAAAERQREREEATERKREEAEARKREREEAAARERARKAAADRAEKAQRALAQAQERTAKAAERLEEAQAREREAIDALDAARSELDALERD
jgi:DNA repair exonuclease SbcCD ATPase subunit